MVFGYARCRFPSRRARTKDLQRTPSQTASSEVKETQATILDQEDSIAPQEPIAISSIRADPRIRSIIVIRDPKPAKHFNHLVDTNYEVVKNFEEHMADVLTFLVSDLLGDVAYSVTEREAFYEIVFPGRHEQVVVAVERGSDIAEIANSITNHLAAITSSN